VVGNEPAQTADEGHPFRRGNGPARGRPRSSRSESPTSPASQVWWPGAPTAGRATGTRTPARWHSSWPTWHSSRPRLRGW